MVAKDPFKPGVGLQHSALSLSGLWEEMPGLLRTSCHVHTYCGVCTHWQWLHRNSTAPHMLMTVVAVSVTVYVAAATAVLLRLCRPQTPMMLSLCQRRCVSA